MPDSRSAAGRVVRRRPLPMIWLAPLLAFLALATWAFASPVGSSPDDDFHLASIWCAAGDRTTLCEEGDTETTRAVATALLSAPCFARDSTASGACLADILKDTRLVESNRGNFAGQYPPLYYSTMSLFATDDIQTSVLMMRLANVMLFVGLVTALAVLLPMQHRRTLLWTWVITVIPLGLFVIASINPSAWAVIGVGTAWIALLGFVDTRGRARIGLGTVFAVASLMAVGSRADAAVYLALTIAAVMFLRFRRGRQQWAPWVVAAAGIGLVVIALLISRQIGVAVGGFEDSVAPAPSPTGAAGSVAVPDPDAATPGGSLLGLFFSNLANAPSLWAGVFGSWSLGWFDTEMPFIVSLGGVGVFVAVTFTGIAVASWRKVIITAAATAGLWMIPVYTLTRGGQMVGVELQPRYLLPLVVVVAGFALLAVGSREFGLTRLQRVLVTGTSIGTQSLALFFTMRRFVTGDDVNGIDLGAHAEWWWVGVPGPMWVWIIGSLSWAALVVIVVRYLRLPPAVAGVDSALETGAAR